MERDAERPGGLKVALIVSGSIACYKACELASMLEDPRVSRAVGEISSDRGRWVAALALASPGATAARSAAICVHTSG